MDRQNGGKRRNMRDRKGGEITEERRKIEASGVGEGALQVTCLRIGWCVYNHINSNVLNSLIVLLSAFSPASAL